MQNKANGPVLWFTGLSGAGKSTLCYAVAARLRAQGTPVEVLDGDDMRQSLCRGLTFDEADRMENVRRITFVAGLLSAHGVTVLIAVIAPLASMREIPRKLCSPFFEIFVDASLAVCERRDPKGLYRRARAGELTQFTGISAPYERPQAPDLVCWTESETEAESVQKVLRFLQGRTEVKG